MQLQGKIQKWGNSSALRLPVEVLATVGISSGDEVDIQANKGVLLIRVQACAPEQAEESLLSLLSLESSHGRMLEQEFEKLLALEPGAAELLAEVKDRLAKAVKLTDETTERCHSLIRKLEHEESL